VWRFGQRRSVERCADLLFVLRITPFVAAVGATLALAVPSFVLFEPRAIDEQMSGWSIVLGITGIAVVLGGLWRMSSLLVKTSQVVSHWSSDARVIDSGPIDDFPDSVPPLRISAFAPPLTVSGVLRPCLWLSRAAQSALTEPELQTAIRHEMVHVRRRDNLRKLILRLIAFPGMKQLEIEWYAATELVADAAAVSSAFEALHLAEAMIKLSRLSLHPPPELSTGLVNDDTDRVVARVMRLITWTEPRPAQKHSLGYKMLVAATVVTSLVLTYGHLLAQVHEATEFLVR
jgi:beta-lactamase regulating signal transducer with metallopeptidase domain